MPTSIYDNPQIQQARSASQDATAAANTESTAGLTLPDMLRSALTSKFSNDNPTYAAREGALTNYLNESTQAPLRVTPKSAGGMSDVVYNPLQQANLIQQYRSGPLAQIATLNDLLGLQTGGIENVIGATSRAHQAYTQGMVQKAQLARTGYEDLLSEMSKRADEAYRQQELALRGAGGISAVQSQGLVTDVKNGMELRAALTKYAGKLQPDEIYQIYNTVHSSPGDAWGPAKETPAQLAMLGIKAAPLTIKQTTQLQDLQRGMDAIDKAQTALDLSGSGLQYLGANGIRSQLPAAMGGIGKSAAETRAALSDVNTQLFKIAGTQFPKNEQGLLGGIVLKLDQNKESNIAALQKARQRLQAQLDQITGGATSGSTDSRPPLSSFER